MKFQPNLSNALRVVYVVIGAALIAGPFLITVGTWERVILPILGLMAVASGATGW